MGKNNITAPMSYKIKGVFFFLVFYVIFFLYLRLLVGENIQLIYFINSFVFIIFIITVYEVKWGLYFFIFLIPLLHSFAGFIIDRPRYSILFLFFGLFLHFQIDLLIKQYFYFLFRVYFF